LIALFATPASAEAKVCLCHCDLKRLILLILSTSIMISQQMSGFCEVHEAHGDEVTGAFWAWLNPTV